MSELDRGFDGEPMLTALALIGRLGIYRPAGREAARAALRRSIQVARDCGDRRAGGTALGILGQLSVPDCDPAQALSLIDRALPLLRAHVDYILYGGREVLPIGGYLGNVPAPTLATLQADISRGYVWIFVLPASQRAVCALPEAA